MKSFITLLVAMVITTNASGLTLSAHNTAVLDTEVSGQSITNLIRTIEGLADPEVILFLNSPGGSVIAGNNLIAYMEGSGKRFTCVAYFAASMAFAIFQACTRPPSA
jgi:ATP-dependent protease ClpP protease subunit